MTPLSTTDYPGRLAAVIFCQGCPWRCGYCHNPHLIPASCGELDWKCVTDFLERRTGLLDAVVFSGGEPTLQHALHAAMREVRAMGYKIGLHTSGAYPTRLKKILPLLDWVGFDIKAPFACYAEITAVPGSGAKAMQSAQLLMASGVPHEFRTTIHPVKTTSSRINGIASDLDRLGANSWIIQEFRAQGCGEKSLRDLAGMPIPRDNLYRIDKDLPRLSILSRNPR